MIPAGLDGMTFAGVPVFIDSPLGLEITKIYSRLSEYWDKEAKELKAKGLLITTLNWQGFEVIF